MCVATVDLVVVFLFGSEMRERERGVAGERGAGCYTYLDCVRMATTTTARRGWGEEGGGDKLFWREERTAQLVSVGGGGKN